MLPTTQARRSSYPLLEDKLVVIRKKLAKAMVGCTVDLMDDSHSITHGIVSGIFLTAGTPKIIVNGQSYDMNRVVTATSASIDNLNQLSLKL